jgi:hypothetical protein
LIFGADPNDEQGEEGPGRILAHRKCNVAPRHKSLQAWVQSRVVETDDGRTIGTSLLIFGDESEVEADELVRVRDREVSTLVQAERFLRQLLADGPHKVKEIEELASDRDATRC